MNTLKFLCVGVVVFFLTCIVVRDYALISTYSSYIGGGFMVLGGIITATVSDSGDRTRAAFSDNEDWRRRSKWAWNAFLIGVPNLIASFAVWYFFLKSPGA
jgi:hypothetical protein